MIFKKEVIKLLYSDSSDKPRVLIPIKPEALISSMRLRIDLVPLIEGQEDKLWRTWSIPKRNDPESARLITSPREPLKYILRERVLPIIEAVPVSKICTGFRKGSSIVKNVDPHVGTKHARAKAVFSFDLKDAFPTVTEEMVKDTLIREMRMHEKLATLLAKLVTYKGKLPQGSPCSPCIFNLVCKPMDGTICRYLSKSNGYHFKVTRYADNFTVSTPRKFIPKIVKENLLEIVERHGFNSHKIRYAEGKAVPRITGLIIVNGKIRIKRDLIERFRGMIHNRLLTFSQVRGIISYTRMTMGHLPKRIANPYFAYLKWWYSEVYYPEKYTKKYTIQDFFMNRY